MLSPTDEPSYWTRQAYAVGGQLAKVAADDPVAVPSYAMTGRLYAATLGDGRTFLRLSVPAALVRGVFDGLHEPGIELPLDAAGRVDAGLIVCRPDEVALAGGPDAFANDRGKPFRYSLGRLVAYDPPNGPHTRVFLLRCHSPELQQLRRTHGLSSLPGDGQYDFSLPVARVRRGVLGRTEAAKDTTPA